MIFPTGSSSNVRLSSYIQVHTNQEHGDLEEDGHGTVVKAPLWKSVRVPGEHWVATYANGHFNTMTTVFPHPPDHGAQEADKEHRDTFYEGKRHFPLHSYIKANCVRYGGEYRALGAEEREQVMG